MDHQLKLNFFKPQIAGAILHSLFMASYYNIQNPILHQLLSKDQLSQFIQNILKINSNEKFFNSSVFYPYKHNSIYGFNSNLSLNASIITSEIGFPFLADHFNQIFSTFNINLPSNSTFHNTLLSFFTQHKDSKQFNYFTPEKIENLLFASQDNSHIKKLKSF